MKFACLIVNIDKNLDFNLICYLQEIGFYNYAAAALHHIQAIHNL